MATVGGKREGAGRKAGQVSAATLAIRALASKHSEKAMKALVTMLDANDVPAASRIAAAREILERAHGKSANFIATTFDPRLSSLEPKDALVAITDKATTGELPIDEAQKLTAMVEARMKAVEVAELQDRLSKLEDEKR